MRLGLFLACALALFASLERASAHALTQHQQLALDIYKELVEINTVVGVGDTARAAEAMATRLRAAGFTGSDVQVLLPVPRKGNLVARLRGTGKRRPILLLAHIDVVDARREDWSVDPFQFTERDGYFYGRGTLPVIDGRCGRLTAPGNRRRGEQRMFHVKHRAVRGLAHCLFNGL